MTIVATEDINYLAQQLPGKLNIILAGMTALMSDIDNKVSAMESQSWFQRMVKTVTGKNKLTLAEIQQNRDKLNAYMAEAISALYDMNRIDFNVLVGLNRQIKELLYGELYACRGQFKLMLEICVSKLNEKINSVDNFHMLTTEISQGFYSQASPIVAVCKVMSQFDNSILEDDRKLGIISRSLSSQDILNSNQIKLTEHLASILEIPIEDVGQIHLGLGTIRGNFMAGVILDTIESYYFLPDLARKIKDRNALIEEIMREKQLDASVSLSIDEIYEDFLDSKIVAKNRLLSVERVEAPSKGRENNGNDIETTQLGIAAIEKGDYTQAVKYFRIAAENGYAEAQNRLGICYLYGKGVTENKSEAFEWNMKAAQQDFPRAQYLVGLCYYYGDGIAKNKLKAFEWNMKAARQNYALAQYMVGRYNMAKRRTRVGCVQFYSRKNEIEAFEWYMKAAQQGYATAQYEAGLCHSYGDSVVKNMREAIIWCITVDLQADSGINPFENSSSYRREDFRVEVEKWMRIDHNVEAAMEWLISSKKQGNICAQSSLKAPYDE